MVRQVGGVRTHDSVGQWLALRLFRDDALGTARAGGEAGFGRQNLVWRGISTIPSPKHAVTVAHRSASVPWDGSFHHSPRVPEGAENLRSVLLRA